VTFLETYALVPVILVGATSLVLLFYPNWRWTLLAVAVQYLAAAWLVSLSWPLGLAAVKLVVGWMAGAVLSTVQAGEDIPTETISGRLFRLIVAALLLVVIFTLPPEMRAWLQVSQPVFWGGMVLAGMGLLQVSMTSNPLRMVLGLLSFLAGFEVLYAALGFSVLVAGLMAAVNLGLALAGTYLLSTPQQKEAG
jgi:hypothetical protein